MVQFNSMKALLAAAGVLVLAACSSSSDDTPTEEPIGGGGLSVVGSADASTFTISSIDVPEALAATISDVGAEAITLVDVDDFSLFNLAAFDPSVPGTDSAAVLCGTNGDASGEVIGDSEFEFCDISVDEETSAVTVSAQGGPLLLTVDLTSLLGGDPIDTTILSTFLYPDVDSISIASTSTFERFSFAVLGNPAIDPATIAMFGAATDAVESFFDNAPAGQFIQDPDIVLILEALQSLIDQGLDLNNAGFDIDDGADDITETTVNQFLNSVLGMDLVSLAPGVSADDLSDSFPADGVAFPVNGTGVFSLVDLVEAQLTAEISEVVDGLPLAFAVSAVDLPPGIVAAASDAGNENVFQAVQEVDFSIVNASLINFDLDSAENNLGGGGDVPANPNAITAITAGILDCAVETEVSPVASDVCTVIDTSDGVHILSVFDTDVTGTFGENPLFATINVGNIVAGEVVLTGEEQGASVIGEPIFFSAPMLISQNEAVEFSFASTALVERMLLFAEDVIGASGDNVAFADTDLVDITDADVIDALEAVEAFFAAPTTIIDASFFDSGVLSSDAIGLTEDSPFIQALTPGVSTAAEALEIASTGGELFFILNAFQDDQSDEGLNAIILDEIPELAP